MDETTTSGISKIHVSLDVQTPMVPNFIRIIVGKETVQVPIEDLTDEQLVQVADSWKTKLINHACQRRVKK